MAERLIRILAFANVADGASVALPHGINVAGTPMTPDLLAMDAGGFSVTADTTNVTVTNTSGGVASVNVWTQLVHSVPREIGAVPLVPSPFVVAAGGGGSSPPRMWSYTNANQVVNSGDPFLTITGFQQTLGKRYTFVTTASIGGIAETPGTLINATVFLLQDSGKPAIQVGLGRAAAPSDGVTGEVALCLSGQGTVVGDGAAHDYIMYVFSNDLATWQLAGSPATVCLTIIEADDQQP